MSFSDKQANAKHAKMAPGSSHWAQPVLSDKQCQVVGLRGLRVDFQSDGREAGEKRTRAIFTLLQHRHALYWLWCRSKQKQAAEKLGLMLKERSWYTHMSMEQYQFRKPSKRVDVCDTCLDFQNKFLPVLKATIPKDESHRRALGSKSVDFLWESRQRS